MYSCPYCGIELDSVLIEEVHSFYGDYNHQEGEISCKRCKGKIVIVASVSAEFLIDSVKNQEGKPDLNPDPVEVAKFMKKRPDELIVYSHELSCTACGRAPGALGYGETKASQLMAAGWRVVQEFPGVRITCPGCLGAKENAS